MLNIKKRIIVSCSASESLVNFRGKLIEELVKNNDVYVFCPRIDDQKLTDRLHNLGVTICENDLQRNSISVAGDLQYIWQLHKVIQKIKPDIFFAYAFKPVIFGTLVASLKGVKGIVAMLSGLGFSFTEAGKKSKMASVVRGLLKISLNSSKRVKVILQNKDDYQELIDYNIISTKNNGFVVNGSGVDLSHYNYSEPDLSTTTFLMMSRLINSKGIVQYYEAAKAVKAKHPQVKFVLIGTFDSGADTIGDELFEKIRTDGTLEYHGWTHDVRPLIKDSSVVVLPSYYREGVPRSVQEGMAMGRAIITTDMVGCKETVNPDPNSKNGFIIPTKNSDVLAEKMEFYVNNPQQIIEHGRNGRSYIEEKFDVRIVNKDMLRILGVN